MPKVVGGRVEQLDAPLLPHARSQRPCCYLPVLIGEVDGTGLRSGSNEHPVTQAAGRLALVSPKNWVRTPDPCRFTVEAGIRYSPEPQDRLQPEIRRVYE